jgi:spore coat protein A
MTARHDPDDALYRTVTVPRRTVLKGAAAAGLFATVPWSTGRVRALVGVTPFNVRKFEEPLPIPGVLTPFDTSGGVDRYEISLTEFEQQVLPEPEPTDNYGTTTVWGYAGTYPGGTIEATPGRPVEVTYSNDLPRDDEHLLSVDTRVHGTAGVPAVRTVTHLHGVVVAPVDDGYPEAWVSPGGVTDDESPVPHTPTKYYPNDQEPTTLWYHDHAIGITRLNVYAGLAGFYLLRDELESELPSGDREVPIVIQDRSFQENGDWFYLPGGDTGPYEAEFFGDTAVVNGKAYPYLEVVPGRYRFRVLNGSNGRTFNLTLYNETTDSTTDVPLFNQIGVDQGFLRSIVTVGPGGDLPSLLLSGAERADVVVDFSAHAGQTFTLRNDAEAPYTGANDPTIFPTTALPTLMQFRVADVPAENYRRPVAAYNGLLGRIGRKYNERRVPDSGIVRQMTLDSGEHDGLDTHFLNLTLWDDETAIVRPTLDTRETWELYNTTGDSHPIHTHLVDFEVVEREGFDAAAFTAARESWLADGSLPEPDPSDYLVPGTLRDPALNERIKKDTVLVNPNEVVRIRPAFTGFEGYYVWHCHILEHEDQEMMPPFEVVA